MVIGTIHEFRGNQLNEDLSPILAQFGYEGRPALMIIDDGAAAESDQTEWNERDLANRNLNAQAAGFSYTASNVSAGTRRRNFTQILAKVIQVTETTEAANMVGGSAIRDQTKLRMVEYLNDLEYTTINATAFSGNSISTPQTMHGLYSWALNFGNTGSGTRAWTTTNSGISATTDNLASMQLRGMRKGVRITDFIVDDTIKRRVSTTASTPMPSYRVQNDLDIIQAIDMFKSDFGGSRLHVSFDSEHESGGTTGLFAMGGAGHGIIGIDRSMIERAWLRRTKMVEKPAVEDAVTMVIKGEVTYRYWANPAIQVDWNVF